MGWAVNRIYFARQPNTKFWRYYWVVKYRKNPRFWYYSDRGLLSAKFFGLPKPEPQGKNCGHIMNFHEFSEITPAKVEALKARIARLGIDLRLIDE